MTVSALESRRSPEHRLAPLATVRLLARKFGEFGDQYRVFSEFRELNDKSIVMFLETAEALNNLPNAVRGNAIGIFQANVGILQIMARQGEIPNQRLDESWQLVVKLFAKVSDRRLRSMTLADLLLKSCFDPCHRRARESFTGGDHRVARGSSPASSADGIRIHKEVAVRTRSVMDGQRLVSLDTLFALGDALREKGQGKALDEFVIHKAGELREFEMPRPIFTNGERTEWAAGIYNNHHTEVQMRTDLAKVLASPAPSPAHLEEARGQLASFLRDTLVGLNSCLL